MMATDQQDTMLGPVSVEGLCERLELSVVQMPWSRDAKLKEDAASTIRDLQASLAGAEARLEAAVASERELAAVWSDFVAKRAAMNAAIPNISSATRAEYALYDERYRADHDAERAWHSAALTFARAAAIRIPAAAATRDGGE